MRNTSVLKLGWWLYVLECERGVLYTGIARDVRSRFEAHAKGIGAKFTRANPPVRILGKAPLASKGEALRAEYAFKQLSRAEKLRSALRLRTWWESAAPRRPARPRG